MFVEWNTPPSCGPSTAAFFSPTTPPTLPWTHKSMPCFIAFGLLSAWNSLAPDFCTRLPLGQQPLSPLWLLQSLFPGPWEDVPSSTLRCSHLISSPISSFSSEQLLLSNKNISFFTYCFTYAFLHSIHSDPRVWAVWWQGLCFHPWHKKRGWKA